VDRVTSLQRYPVLATLQLEVVSKKKRHLRRWCKSSRHQKSKAEAGRKLNYESELTWYVSKYGKEEAQDLIKKSWKVVPVNFSQEHKQMLLHTKKSGC
jgi:hypothetical protein